MYDTHCTLHVTVYVDVARRISDIFVHSSAVSCIVIHSPNLYLKNYVLLSTIQVAQIIFLT